MVIDSDMIQTWPAWKISPPTRPTLHPKRELQLYYILLYADMVLMHFTNGLSFSDHLWLTNLMLKYIPLCVLYIYTYIPSMSH